MILAICRLTSLEADGVIGAGGKEEPHTPGFAIEDPVWQLRVLELHWAA